MAASFLEPEDSPGDRAAPATPHRVLVVSADMGGGHNATATALEEAVQRLWPGSETSRIDALDVMGPGVGRLFRGIYVGNVERTPWLYEFFYANLWRHRWFSRASKRFTGSWCGRRLVKHIERFDPDCILSTYPLGSSGLAWLRRHRGLTVPVGCWVSDFAPHPFWVYGDVDANFVMHEAAVPVARAAEPGAPVEVCAPPVVSRFRPGPDGSAQARERLGLRPDALVVLVSCGAYAFGDVAAMVRALAAASERVQVVAACGRNTEVKQALEGLGFPRASLVPWGWTDDMAGLVQASDLVITNAGGATALEALACGVPLLTANPIAAHGRANADLMTVAGLTDLCDDLERLTALVRTAAEDPSTLQPLRDRIREHTARTELDGGLARLAAPRTSGPPVEPMSRRPWRMRAADAFFADVETEHARQELGVVLELRSPAGSRLTASDVHRALQPRVAGLPPARRELVRRPRMGWRLHERVDVTEHIGEHVLDPDASEADAWASVGRFWATPLGTDRPAWQMLLVRGRAHGPDLLAVKMHHCQGDGISALGLLDRLLDTSPGDPLPERKAASDAANARLRRAAGPVSVARGLFALAGRGTAPKHPLNADSLSPHREVVGVPLPWPEVRRLAGEHGVRPHELVIAIVADALDRFLRPLGLVAEQEEDQYRPLRAMVPVAMRPPRLDRIAGNWTGSLAVNLPMGPMPFEERVRRVHDDVLKRTRHGEAPAASMVMTLAGWLPESVHRWVAQRVYTRRFFNTVVSYMPGARGPRRVGHAEVSAYYPVLPLAAEVPVTVGAIVADETVGIGILLDRQLGLDRDQVSESVRAAFGAAGGRLLTTARSSRSAGRP
ncbi:MAG TPA: wax ester/triacylglycerol synthase domain-containing protein [Nocardioidaceae bacterium]|jgi:WS/DGAT/MGAT family acyltransferase